MGCNISTRHEENIILCDQCLEYCTNGYKSSWKTFGRVLFWISSVESSTNFSPKFGAHLDVQRLWVRQKLCHFNKSPIKWSQSSRTKPATNWKTRLICPRPDWLQEYNHNDLFIVKPHVIVISFEGLCIVNFTTVDHSKNWNTAK